MSPGAFLLVGVLATATFLVSQSAWGVWRGRDFNAAFELPKLLVLVAMLYVGVRRSDEARRREFAIRVQQACRIRGRGRGRVGLGLGLGLARNTHRCHML